MKDGSSCAALSEAEGRRTTNAAIPNSSFLIPNSSRHSSFNIPHSFDEWRRAALHDVVGAAAPSSFRAVTQRDYAAVMDYFLSLAGERRNKEEGIRNKCGIGRSAASGLSKPGGRESADTTLIPYSLFPITSQDERRRALWALNLVEGEVADDFGGRGGARSYADALFWRIHKTDRYTANARQVWAVIFTLRKRSSKIRAKTALGARGAADVH